MSNRDEKEGTDISGDDLSGDRRVGAAYDPSMVAGSGASAGGGGESIDGSDGSEANGRRKRAAGNRKEESSKHGRRPEAPSEEGSEGGRIKRIAGETRGLIDDLKEWVDLKIQLFQLDIEDRIRQAANQAALTAVVLVIALLAALFALVAAGEALGAWFDSRSLGFLALAGILALIAVLIHAFRPRLVEPARTHDEKPDQLPEKERETPALPAHGPDGSAVARPDQSPAPTREDR